MSSKLYWHNATNALTGTFPTDEQSASTATLKWTGATTLRRMSKSIGALQVSQGQASGTTAAHLDFLRYFVSSPLSGAQTVGGGAISMYIAAAESNLAENFIINRMDIYVWRPSGGGSKIGTVLTAATAPNTAATEMTATGSEQVDRNTWNSSSSVSASDGDCIVVEIWANYSKSTTTRTLTVYYDGTTENTTENAVVSSHAGYILFAETLAFQGPGAPTVAITEVAGKGFMVGITAGTGTPTGYRLDVATASDFSAFVSGYQDVDIGLNLKDYVKGLSLSTQYWVRARAYDAEGTSASSSSATDTTLAATKVQDEIIDRVTNLRGYWRLGETSGTTVYDYSGNRRHSTAKGAGVTLNQTGLLAAQASDKCADFIGTDGTGTITLPDSWLAASMTDFAWGAWCVNDALSGYDEIMSLGASSGDDLFFGARNTTPQMYSQDWGAPGPDVDSSGAISTGVTYLLGASRSGSDITFIKNGASNGTASLGTAVGMAATFRRIGGDGTGASEAWDGKLQEVWIAEAAVATSDYLAIYNKGTSSGTETPQSVDATSATSITMARAVTRAQSIAATSPAAVAMARAVTRVKTIAATSPAVAVLQRQVGKIVAATSPASAVVRKQVGHILSATSATAAVVRKQVGKIVSATSPAVAVFATLKAKAQAINATSATVATMTRQVGKIVAASSSVSAVLQRQVGKIVAATSASAAVVRREVGKHIDAISPAAAVLTMLKVKMQTVAATVSTAITMSRQVGKIVSASSAVTAAFQRTVNFSIRAAQGTSAVVLKQVGKIVSATSAASAVLTKLRVKLQDIAATVGTSAVITRQVGHILSATAGTSVVVIKQVGKTLAAVSATLTSVRKSVSRTISATSATVADMTRSVGKLISASSATVAEYTRSIGKILNVTSHAAAVLSHVDTIAGVFKGFVRVTSSAVWQAVLSHGPAGTTERITVGDANIWGETTVWDELPALEGVAVTEETGGEVLVGE